MRDTFLNEVMRPVSDRARWNPERRLLRETHAGTSRRCVLPREKGENGTGMADLVAVVEMVGARIVEIYRLFDKAQTIALGIAPAAPAAAFARGRLAPSFGTKPQASISVPSTENPAHNG